MGLDAGDQTSSGYKVEVEEQPCVFGGVITLQLQKMMVLLGTLKTALVRGEKSSHITMLNLVALQTREQLLCCTTACSEVLGQDF